MEDIAEAADVGKGTLYRYFKDKEELYMALLARAADQMAERLRAVEAVAGPRARLVAMVEAILDYFDEHPHLLDLIQHAEVMQGPDADLPWQRTRLENVRLLEDVFEEARKNGDFFVADPELAAWMLLGGLRPVLRWAQSPARRTSPGASSISSSTGRRGRRNRGPSAGLGAEGCALAARSLQSTGGGNPSPP